MSCLTNLPVLSVTHVKCVLVTVGMDCATVGGKSATTAACCTLTLAHALVTNCGKAAIVGMIDIVMLIFNC